MLMQYATALPELDFLLVATRNSGRIASFPGNVRVSSLASYAGATSVREEYEGLLRRWYDLKIKLRQSKEFALLFDLGALDLFSKLLSVGLEIRNAWISVFADEPISSVLCGDDANPRTRIPVLLSASRGLPTLSCHHGAIDGRYRFRRVHPGILLAKSRMEYDYLVRSCGVSPEKLEIVAPAFDPLAPTAAAANPTSIVFFSEPYEISGGRCKEFYRDLLPPLAELAVRHNCELVIKLHPMESLHERQRFAEAALSKDQLQRSRVISGPLDGELLAQTWFAVTVLSTTAIDCARRHIPCFLCQWLDNSNYDYQKQFLKFGAATVLRSPEDLLTIPSQLETYSWPEKSDLWEANSDKRLERLLQGSQRAKDVLASA